MCRLLSSTVIPDGFYEPWGDYPEVVEKGEFPMLAALKHVRLFEGDEREVGNHNNKEVENHLLGLRMMG